MIVQVKSAAQSGLVAALLSMHDSGELCDFSLISGTNSVKAHKCVLAATIEYFRTSFRFSETCRNDTSIDLSHLNCDLYIIQQVIRSLYSNEIDLNKDNIEGILHLSDFLLYKDLISCVEQFMENTLRLKNVIVYFRLCVQYNLNNTSLSRNVRRLLRGRFHDYLIYEPETKEVSMYVLTTMHFHGLMDNCTPLQLMAFFMEKLTESLLKKQVPEEDLDWIVSFLEYTFPCNSSFRIYWNPAIKDYLNKWLLDNCKHLLNHESLSTRLKCLLQKFPNGAEINSSGIQEAVDGDDNLQNMMSSSLSGINQTQGCEREGLKDNLPQSDRKFNDFPSTSHSSSPVIPSSSNISDSSVQGCADINEQQFQEKAFTSSQASQNSSEILTVPNDSLKVSSINEDMSDVLVVLGPSSQMASQLMEVEAQKETPLLKAPKLCLYLYDTKLRCWKEGIGLDFPISGHMQEKQSWRIAFAHSNLYMFSLSKKVGLEFCMENSEWTILSCDEIFLAHSNRNNEKFPVKSIIPVSVGGHLLVLSMSREARHDGSYRTQQHLYQFNPKTKLFSHLTYVRDKRMDLPMTKWTVKDDELFTVKASTLMYHDLQLYNVQYVHVYNIKTEKMTTHTIQGSMKLGLKLLVQANKLYLLNNLGEYQQLDLTSSQVSEWQSISNPAFTTVNNSVNNQDRDAIYPALLRTTCHAGSSRWTVNVQDNIGSASLQEMSVTEDGDFITNHHPSPPFLYLTAMCVGKINRKKLDSLKLAQFDYNSLYCNFLNG